MNRVTSHDDLAELLGAHALDAVEPEEAELLNRHLEICPRCRAELRGHRETAALLGYIGGPAPAGLWDQIVASAQEAPPALRLEARATPVVSASPAGATPQGPPIAEIRRHRKRSLRVRTLAIAAGVAAAVVAALSFQVSRLDHQTSALNNRVASLSPGPSMSAVRMALSTPGSRRVHLASLSSKAMSADAVVLPSGQGYVYNAQVEPLRADRTYQLWGVVGDQRISFGLLGSVPAAVVPFHSSPGAQALAVTSEVSDGVERSSEPLVVVGPVGAARFGPISKSDHSHI
ncbi:MAG: anti-sigma factor [Actinomycetota bacterium]|nr:anti-sigma factor [Actinomycetota bacterium]MDQ6946870.1 anti-sigma factor [Actinomycetota bacterium]